MKQWIKNFIIKVVIDSGVIETLVLLAQKRLAAESQARAKAAYPMPRIMPEPAPEPEPESTPRYRDTHLG